MTISCWFSRFCFKHEVTETSLQQQRLHKPIDSETVFPFFHSCQTSWKDHTQAAFWCDLSESELKHTHYVINQTVPCLRREASGAASGLPKPASMPFFFPFCPAVMTNKRCGLRACGQTQWEAEYPGAHLQPVAEGGNWRVGRLVVDTNSFFFFCLIVIQKYIQ